MNIHDEWWLMMDLLWIIGPRKLIEKCRFFFLFGPADGGACKMIYDLGNLGTTQKVIVCFVDTWAYRKLPCQEWWNFMVIWSDLFEIIMIVVHILSSTQIEDVSTQSLFQLLCSSLIHTKVVIGTSCLSLPNSMFATWLTVDIQLMSYSGLYLL